jgi:PAT family beta-lactamase induction signal transducer AmpG
MQHKILKVIFSRRMVVSFIMGFACGLPLLLTITVLQAWMKEEGVDLAVIGLFALVGLPYTLKFLWAPFLDRFTLPFLGRRRGWLIVAQILLICSIAGLGLTSPGKSPWIVALAAFLVTFFSASQDIIVDAYRREDLADEELGLGSSFYVNGYRIGMLLASGGGLIMADHMSFAMVYLRRSLIPLLSIYHEMVPYGYLHSFCFIKLEIPWPVP